MIRTSSLLVSFVIAAWGLVLWSPVASAQETPQETPRILGDPIPHEQVLSTERYQDCGLRKRAVNAFVSHRPAPKRSQQTTSTIEVDYGTNFTPEAREAFERAVDIWETHISSPVPIQVEASYEALGAGVLAAAGPNNFYGVDASGNGEVDDVVGDALRDAIVGEDPSPQEADIIVNVNSQRDDWHFGPGDAPSGTIDFTSVALHELGHGLNYIGLFSLDQGQGEYFSDTLEGNRVVGVYDRQVLEEQGDGTLRALTNTTLYPNPSAELGEALTSGQLFFGGEASEATAALGDGPPRPKLYAPPQFSGGSSIAHLDEEAYPFETQNALMTPRINQAETNRQPGPILCGQLRDMGWPLGSGCQQYFRDLFAVSVQEVNGQSGSRTLSWREKDDANIQEYIVDRRYFDGAFEEIKRVDASEVSGSSLTVENLGLGAFTFRLRWVQGDSTVTSPERVRDTIAARDVAASISGRDQQERGTVDLSWTVPPGTSSDFVYQIERREGRDGPFEPVASVLQKGDAGEEQSKQYTAERQTPGRYEYRVRAQDAAGNAVTSASREVEVDFEGEVYALGPYPNPVRETASFDLTARESQDVQVEVYNTLGEQVYRDEREVRPQDPTFLSIDVSQWASGVYFLRLRGDGSVGQTKKMIVVQ
jgi:hypothetical protein